MAGARSASWDTAFAVQALAAAKDHAAVVGPAERGSDFLATQQIRHTFDGYRDADRIDPNGGWCFAGVWHGWPVSDCTAEAVLALAKASDTDPEQLYDGVRFILRCQNRDGGFGSYEPRRLRFDLERINPAEMFGDSMSETSWVECTASCLAALAEVRKRDPGPIPGAINNEAVPAMARAVQWLRTRQQGDGSWPGTWGVHFYLWDDVWHRGDCWPPVLPRWTPIFEEHVPGSRSVSAGTAGGASISPRTCAANTLSIQRVRSSNRRGP